MDWAWVDLSGSFLREVGSDPRPPARLERVLAVARAFLAVTALFAIYFDPTEPQQFAGLAYGLLLIYAVYSLVVLALVHASPRLLPRHTLLLHAFDVLWTSLLTFISAGPVSPFFLFFLFTVIAAAYRWGFKETIWTTGVVLVVVSAQTAAFISPWRPDWFPDADVEVNRTIIRFAYLLMTAFLIGYLAEQEKRFRIEIATMAQVSRHTQVDAGLGGTIGSLGSELCRLLGARSAIVVTQEFHAPGGELWRVTTNAADGTGPTRRIQLTPAETRNWLFDDPGGAWQATLDGDLSIEARATAPGIWPLRRIQVTLPESVRKAGAADSITAANLGLTEEWHGRIYLLDVPRSSALERPLHFLDTLTEHVAPALTNVFLQRRLRSQVTVAERARVARELHDGAIQALFGIEMKIEAMRRSPLLDAVQMRHDLNDIQQLVQHEVLALRELMQALKPMQLDATDQLPDVLASVVERFRRDTGVSARFIAQGTTPATLHPGTALELVRIVQEALVNVRKHSRARNVLVRLTRDNGHSQLVVEDDGQGFAFSGRLSSKELDDRRIGPAIIKERARVVGAALAVESSPGIGSRLEITLADA